jgi:hypothetical protein
MILFTIEASEQQRLIRYLWPASAIGDSRSLILVRAEQTAAEGKGFEPSSHKLESRFSKAARQTVSGYLPEEA